MCSIDTFKIDLKQLNDGQTKLRFGIGDEFFEAIDAPDVRKGELTVEVVIDKNPHFVTLDFHTEGVVCIPCDLCLDDMAQPIETENRLVVKFGNSYSEDDDIITVDENEGILDTAWFIYESIALAIPIKHVHAPGKCNPAMSKMLVEHSAARSSEGESETTIDPRWEKLKNIKI